MIGINFFILVFRKWNWAVAQQLISVTYKYHYLKPPLWLQIFWWDLKIYQIFQVWRSPTGSRRRVYCPLQTSSYDRVKRQRGNCWLKFRIYTWYVNKMFLFKNFIWCLCWVKMFTFYLVKILARLLKQKN